MNCTAFSIDMPVIHRDQEMYMIRHDYEIVHLNSARCDI